jgi:hypothetical protein
MFVHSVYFWLKPNLSAEQHAQFTALLQKLTVIPSVRYGFTGRPAATDRPVIDRSYSHALTVVFDDLCGHDAYQQDPCHLEFVNQCKTFWSSIKIYDAE